MPKIVDHDEYRKEILEKCMGVFSKKGFANTTMRQIADEIGVSTGTLYHYFPTKLAILEQLFDHVRVYNIGDYLSRVKNVSTVEEKIEIISSFWMEYGDYYRTLILLGVDLFMNHNSGSTEQVFADFSDDYRNAMARELEIPAEVSTSLFIYLMGLMLHQVLTPGKISYSDQINIIRKMLLGYAKNRHARDILENTINGAAGPH